MCEHAFNNRKLQALTFLLEVSTCICFLAVWAECLGVFPVTPWSLPGPPGLRPPLSQYNSPVLPVGAEGLAPMPGKGNPVLQEAQGGWVYTMEAFSSGLAFVFIVQAYKEWKIISSFTPSSECREESQPMIEVPLENCSSSQGRALPVNPEMYKVSISQGSAGGFDGEPVSRALLRRRG